MGQTPPQPSISFAYENGSDTGEAACDLSAGGSGGDGVAADAVDLVTGVGWARWPDCSDALGTVRAGGAAEVDVDGNAMLRVVWQDGEGDGSATLGTWQGPAA